MEQAKSLFYENQNQHSHCEAKRLRLRAECIPWCFVINVDELVSLCAFAGTQGYEQFCGFRRDVKGGVYHVCWDKDGIACVEGLFFLFEPCLLYTSDAADE